MVCWCGGGLLQVMKVHAVIMGSLNEYENQKIEEWGRDVEASSQVGRGQASTHRATHRATPLPPADEAHPPARPR